MATHDPEREEGDELLRHPLRAAIVDLLAGEPGLNKEQLARRLDCTGRTLRFHLRMLQQHRRIVTRTADRGTEVHCFLPDDAHLWNDPRTRILFGSGCDRTIAELLLENPRLTARDIGQRLGLRPTTVRHHLRVMREHDLVEQVREGRSSAYVPSRALAQWHMELHGGEIDPPGPDTHHLE